MQGSAPPAPTPICIPANSWNGFYPLQMDLLVLVHPPYEGGKGVSAVLSALPSASLPMLSSTAGNKLCLGGGVVINLRVTGMTPMAFPIPLTAPRRGAAMSSHKPSAAVVPSTAPTTGAPRMVQLLC